MTYKYIARFIEIFTRNNTKTLIKRLKLRNFVPTKLRNFFSNMNQEFELIAKTFQGLEEVLAQELTELGAGNIEIGRRMVSFTGDKAMMYKANFCLRTAIRILKPIKHFTANSADEVYDAVKSIEWDEYLDNMSSFSVDAVVFSEEFRHSKFVAYKVKETISAKRQETVLRYVSTSLIWVSISTLQKTSVLCHSTAPASLFTAAVTVRNR